MLAVLLGFNYQEKAPHVSAGLVLSVVCVKPSVPA